MANNSTSASYRVYKKLRDKICSIQINPGNPLIESRIAQELEVSRTPVREAFQRLEREGLISLIPGKGAFVSQVKSSDLEEIFIVREALEGMAARLATPRIPDKVLEDLEEEFMRLDKEWNTGSNLERVDEIHDIVLKYSDNRLINKIFSDFEAQIERFQNFALELPERDKLSYREHKKIYQALRLKDPEAAEKRMRYHLRSTKGSLMDSLLINK